MNDINNKNTELVPQNLPRRKAAIYARMSTEHQKYSIENQEAAMIDYANVCNMDISVRYIDDGKSGLTIESRDALTNLKLKSQKFHLPNHLINSSKHR